MRVSIFLFAREKLLFCEVAISARNAITSDDFPSNRIVPSGGYARHNLGKP